MYNGQLAKFSTPCCFWRDHQAVQSNAGAPVAASVPLMPQAESRPLVASAPAASPAPRRNRRRLYRASVRPRNSAGSPRTISRVTSEAEVCWWSPVYIAPSLNDECVLGKPGEADLFTERRDIPAAEVLHVGHELPVVRSLDRVLMADAYEGREHDFAGERVPSRRHCG